MSQDDLYYRYMTHAGYFGSSFEKADKEKAEKALKKEAAKRKKRNKVKEDTMGGGSSDKVYSGPVDMQLKSAIERMVRCVNEARDQGEELRQREAAEMARVHREELDRRKLKLVAQMDKLPGLMHDAVANGCKCFEFYPVDFKDVETAGLNRYNPKPGSDVYLMLELLGAMDLIADIEGTKDGREEGKMKSTLNADAFIVVQV